MPYSIMLDAGHGGERDPGAVYNGRQEKDDALRLTLAVGEILQNNGIDVQYTRTTDVYQTPYEKAMEANNAGVDFFISIHRNSYPTDNEVSGVETLVYDLSGLKYQMAQDINDQLEAVGFVNLGVNARPNLVVLKRTKMPALLVEAGCIGYVRFGGNYQRQSVSCAGRGVPQPKICGKAAARAAGRRVSGIYRRFGTVSACSGGRIRRYG